MNKKTEKDAVTAALLVVSLYAYLTAATNTELGLWQFVFFFTVGVIGLTVTLCRVWPFVSRKRYEALDQLFFTLQENNRYAAGEIKKLSWQNLALEKELAKYKRPRNEKGQFVRREG